MIVFVFKTKHFNSIKRMQWIDFLVKLNPMIVEVKVQERFF